MRKCKQNVWMMLKRVYAKSVFKSVMKLKKKNKNKKTVEVNKVQN